MKSIKEKIIRLFLVVAGLFEKIPGRPIWLFVERGDDACDNGLWMFSYMQNVHPEIDSRYVITANSSGRKNLLGYENSIVTLPSLTFYYCLLRSRCLLSAHFMNCMSFVKLPKPIFNFIYRIVISKKIVRLQHGITHQDMDWFFRQYYRTDLFICGAKREREFIIEKGYFPADIVKYTGLARFDGLHDININEGEILLMPTWRHWIKEEKQFAESQYFQTFKDLLLNRQLHKVLDNNKLTINFCIHPCFRNYNHLFQEISLPRNIKIMDTNNINIQELLKQSAMLITDYSSVAFDFAYMEKPICYFQFDEKEYRKNDFGKGYYDHKQGFGLWSEDVDGLINCIEKYAKNNMSIFEEHRKRIEEFFTIRDNKNCKRIYEETIRIL